ncbi:MAG: UPF0175 family protein [Nitrospirae bacterium]|nr:UPF0175 family protein [Nitrospirota bacterium]
MKRTNILLTEDQHNILKRYARKETKTMGELIREAVDHIYQEEDVLEKRRRIALEAYQEGFLSMGRLSEILGMSPVSAREYLNQKKIPLQTQDQEEILRDARNA